ncbi:MAG: hypothetical protein ACE5JA_10495 [bacterium]
MGRRRAKEWLCSDILLGEITRGECFMVFPILLGFLLLSVLIASFLIFAQVVRLEYREHRTEWEKDGKPMGFFWKPPESILVGGSLGLNRLCFYWLFKTPEWIRQNAKGMSLLRWLRICGVIWNVGIIVLAILMFSAPMCKG